jgi:predicted Ser/Thr protein kinase
MNEAIGSLLAWLHRHFGAASCPGDWVRTIVALGVLIGLVGLVCAVLIVVLRRIMSGRDSVPMAIGSALLGVASQFALPVLVLVGVTTAVPAAALRAGHSPLAPPGAGTGLSDADLAGFAHGYCRLPPQGRYLASARTVIGALTDSDAGLTVYVARLGTLVGMPILIGLCLWWLGRVVFRSGPAWQPWLFPGLFLALVLVTVNRSANVMGLAWCGVLPVAVLGPLVCRLIAGPKPRAAATVVEQDGPTTVLSSGGVELSPQRLADGRFQPLRELGRGGFGAVWLCLDTSLNRKVAVKIAHTVEVDNRQRMRREAKALAAIRHPNCVHIHDLVENDATMAIIMEYITGRSLTDVIRTDGPFDDNAAAQLWADTASALLAAHQVGVLHRDIKPTNVLIDSRGAPCLIDFGIARTAGDPTVTVTGAVIGTPSYLPPEVAAGEPATPESDVWQLAATVNYALTGQPPRGARDDDRQAWAAAIKGAPCSAIAAGSTHHTLLATSLDNDPTQRPSLSDLITALTGAEDTAPAAG